MAVDLIRLIVVNKRLLFAIGSTRFEIRKAWNKGQNSKFVANKDIKQVDDTSFIVLFMQLTGLFGKNDCILIIKFNLLWR